MITWVIGAGGLLGSAVARQSDETFSAGPIPWADADAAAGVLRTDARRFCEEAGAQDWSIIWAAGAATTSTDRETALAELTPLRGLLEGIRSARPAGRGAVFLTSSAGGVYAGSQHPPFTALTRPQPLSHYGELKLAQEALATDLLAGVCPLVIGRVSNLYGPGQNLAKLQGLISRLALCAVTRQPIDIFVALDTIRDYIYVDDAARAIQLAVDDALEASPQARIQVIASGQAITVGQVVATVNHVAHRRVPVAYGLHPSAAAQAADLRLEATVPLRDVMPFPAGVKLAYEDILDRVQQRVLVS